MFVLSEHICIITCIEFFYLFREFYEIFSVENDLYSISGEEIAKYASDSNEWVSVYEFPITREWDTAIGMNVMNYCV